MVLQRKLVIEVEGGRGREVEGERGRERGGRAQGEEEERGQESLWVGSKEGTVGDKSEEREPNHRSPAAGGERREREGGRGRRKREEGGRKIARGREEPRRFGRRGRERRQWETKAKNDGERGQR